MCLTDRNGSDLGLLRKGRAPGRRQLCHHRNKIFISAGEHDMAEISSISCLARCRMRRQGQGHIPVHRAQVQ